MLGATGDSMNRNDLTLGDAIACTLLGAPLGILTLLALSGGW